MPTYEYKCDACGYAFEKFHSITAKPIRKCPRCGKLKIRRLLGTGAGMIFKGSGFYITDYRSEGYKSAAKADSGTTSSGGSSDTKSKEAAKPAATESKPAAKTESKSQSKSSKKS
ncbi:MAG TPA: FmdB family zinc ribbon protein [Tepidisphaeraceae bacterium]|nr:FmdB family zinc ribbon protein [Tepidisphaeraceae bacterium]